jgi:hypothetical protein
MKRSSRRRGDGPSYPIPVWNGILDHRAKIGNALWEFLWCLDRITEEKDGIGLVLGGKPVRVEEIMADVPGSDRETVRQHMIALAAHKYIRRVRTPYGYRIEVLNSNKQSVWRKREEQKPQNLVSPPQTETQKDGISAQEKPQITVGETVNHGERNRVLGVSKEDTAVDTARDAAVGAAAALWEALDLNPKVLRPAFRKFAEEMFAKRGDQAPLETAGPIMDGWETLGNKIPATFYGALVEARARAKTLPVKTAVPVLEAEEWAR